MSEYGVRMFVRVSVCTRMCVHMFVDALKAKSIPEPILECQIHFPAECMQVLLQMGM